MWTRAPARLMLSVIGLCTLCACHDARSLAEAALAKPHEWIEAQRRCQIERLNHRADDCMRRRAKADRRRDAAAGDLQ